MSPRAAKFTAVNQSVLNIDENGLARVIGHGESAVSVWCLQQIAVGTVTVPFSNAVPAATFADAPRRNWIDTSVLEKLQSLNLPPSPRSSDAEFLRRSFLDTIGVLPTIAETRAFTADPAPDRRDRLIETLLAPPGVRRLLELQVERPAARDEAEAEAGRHVGLLPVHSRCRRVEYAVG